MTEQSCFDDLTLPDSPFAATVSRRKTAAINTEQKLLAGYYKSDGSLFGEVSRASLPNIYHEHYSDCRPIMTSTPSSHVMRLLW